jgi:hypothetical protein
MELDKLLQSNTFVDEIIKIGEKFDLHIDQVGGLDTETREVLLGTKKKEDFAKNIMEHIEVSESIANSLVKEINDNIFLKIRELLQQVDSESTTSDPETPEEILKHIEDGGLELPAPAPEPLPAPTPTPEPTPTPIPEPTTTPELTDHLLQNTVASPHIETKKTYSVDPYREPIN